MVAGALVVTGASVVAGEVFKSSIVTNPESRSRFKVASSSAFSPGE